MYTLIQTIEWIIIKAMLNERDIIEISILMIWFSFDERTWTKRSAGVEITGIIASQLPSTKANQGTEKKTMLYV